jgi:RHS repeat-associated protein
MTHGHRSVGHPVDIATGAMFLAKRDVDVPGRVRLVWTRRYHTGLLDRPTGPLGPGWTCPLFVSLALADRNYRFVAPEGNLADFPDPSGEVVRGGVVRDYGSYQELSWSNGRHVVTRWDVNTGAITRYVFADRPVAGVWPLAAIENATGQGVDLVRDRAGRLIEANQRLEKRSLVIGYGPGDRVRRVAATLPNGETVRTVNYTYDESGRLIAALDADGVGDRFEYDTAGRMTREVKSDGQVYTFRYDAEGRCVYTSGRDRYDEKRLRWQPAAGLTQVTDSYGHTSFYRWNSTGQVVSETDPLGGTSRTDYDEHGRVVAETDAAGNTTKYEYDAAGNRFRTTLPNGAVSEYAFNAARLPVQLIDPRGVVWWRVYDDSNRVVGVGNSVGGGFRMRYDAAGNLTEVQNPLGGRRQWAWSATSSLEAVTDYSGNRTAVRYDGLGRLIEQVTPSGDVYRHRYDRRGNLVEADLPDGTTVRYAYDLEGNMTAATDGEGRTTRYRYGACGRKLERVDQAGNVGRYEWGTEPKRLDRIVNQRGEVYEFRYDPAGRVIEEVGFDGRRVRIDRDVAGRAVAITNGAGERVEYAYTAGRQVGRVGLPDGSAVEYAYDTAGAIVGAVTADCQLTLSRDALGGIVRTTQGDHTVEWERDDWDCLTRIRTSLGYDLRIDYDPNGLTARMTFGADTTIRMTRDSDGNEVARHLPGGVVLRQEFDPMCRLVRQEVGADHSGSTPLVNRTYRFDRAGAIVGIADDAQATFAYAPGRRIGTADWGGGVVEHFDYDPTGNLTSRRGQNGAAEAFEYAPGNRLVRRGETEYEYDANGRLATKREGTAGGPGREWRYTWDALDQLRTVRMPDGAVWKYGYDGFGRRVSKTGPAGTETTVWSGHVPVHVVGDGAVVSSWVFDVLGFQPILTEQSGRPYAVITDRSGLPRELVGPGGKVEWSADYWLWGQTRGTSGAAGIDCPVRFPGQWHDPETGLHYNRFRYYDPSAGRYISPDPIRLQGGWNLYAYGPDPLNWCDPYGLADLFRGMLTDADGRPIVHSGENANGNNAANSLGVRPNEMPSADDPGRGMSTNVSPTGMPEHRRPEEFGGTQDAKKPGGMFRIDDQVLAQHGLQAIPDGGGHVTITTAPGIPESELPARLAATKDEWERVTPEQLAKEQEEAKNCT